MSSITLNTAVIGPLRYALYSQVSVRIDVLDGVLVLPERERNLRVHDAYQKLTAVGDLLDAIGWQEQDSKDTLTVSTADEARLILDALEVEWGVEIDETVSTRELGEDRRLVEAEQRCAAVRDAACAVEAAGLAAGLLDEGADELPE